MSDPVSESAGLDNDFINEILEEARALRLPGLCGDRADALYEVSRGDVTVVALRTTALTDDELDGLLLYRLAHYLNVGFVNVPLVIKNGWRREPAGSVTARDVHIVAADARSGEILCYAAIRAVDTLDDDAPMRSTNRVLLPVEHEHGRGVFNRLNRLSDLPVGRVRECGRFVKNQFTPVFDPGGLRSPVEVCVAIFRLLIGPLNEEVDAVVGDFEEEVARRNLAYFHIPLVMIEGTLPYVAADSYILPRYDGSSTYPFAFWVSDLFGVVDRLKTIEAALSLPGDTALHVLLALKFDRSALSSSLAPAPGTARLNEVRLPQREVAMGDRRALRETAEFLLSTKLFGGLSLAEATVLTTFFERGSFGVGDAVVRQGDVSDDLYVIEEGAVEVLIETPDGERRHVNRLGRGQYFGEVAVVTGGRRMATVVATVPTTVLQLSGSAYAEYLSQTGDVGDHLAETAATRLAGAESSPPPAVAGDRPPGSDGRP
jgi:hypothetical protein